MPRTKYKAKCLRKCYWLDRFWVEGRIYVGYKVPPPHFEILEPKRAVTPKDEDDLIEEIIDEDEEDDDTGSDQSKPGLPGSSADKFGK